MSKPIALNKAEEMVACQHHLLSNREKECLNWIALGKTTAEIAIILNLRPKTIESYIEAAKHKMDCVSRTQAVVKAIQLRLIKPDVLH